MVFRLRFYVYNKNFSLNCLVNIYFMPIATLWRNAGFFFSIKESELSIYTLYIFFTIDLIL